MGTVRKILNLLDRREKISAAGLLLLVIVTAIIETAGIASIVPFLAVLADPSIIHSQPLLKQVYGLTGLETEQQFLFFLGFAVLAILVVTNAISASTTWLLTRFTHMRAHSLACRLLEVYLYQPYNFFLGRDSSEMAKNLLTEVLHVVKNCIVSFMRIIAKTISCFFILGLLVAIDPGLAVSVALTLGVAYSLIYLFIQKKLIRIGEIRVRTNTERYKIFSEIFSSIKDIKVMGRERSFLKLFERPSSEGSMAYAHQEITGTFPRYILETFSFGGMLVIVLYLLSTQNDLRHILPVIGLYAFAGQRLMPALQIIFLNISQIRYAMPSLNDLNRELELAKNCLPSDEPSAPMPFNSQIIISNLAFRFETMDRPILDNINLSIQKNTTVGIVGGTGAGKSTLIDILLGLLEPQKGHIEIDGIAIDRDNVRAWQKNIGYVSQNIVLLNDTFLRNVAFGLPDDAIDMDTVKKVLKSARMDDFIFNDTPHGLNTIIGENGIRLSGGQRQRLGLARALYRDPSVLLLDEATSALDNITEKEVMEAINSLAHKKTILMIAHRLSTVQNCDVIHYLERGKVIASGTYDELMDSSQEFKKLARGGQ